MKVSKIIIYLLPVSLFLGGCTAKANQEEPIKIALTQDIISFDPMQTSDIFSEAILRCVYNTLFDLNENLELVGDLAKEVKQIDEISWQIEIYDDIYFQDGKQLTTEDIVFSIERAMQGGRTQKSLEIVESIEMIDETNFIIKSKEAYADFLTLFAKAETSIVAKHVVENPDYDFVSPIGTGPFKFVNRVENEVIKLEKNDQYFAGKVASNGIEFQIIITEQERTTALLDGTVDILFSVSAYDCDKFRVSQDVNLIQRPSTKIEYLSLNTTHEPLNDSRVRKAISYAINRDAIVDNVYHGYANSSTSLIPNGVIGYKEPEVTYDLTLAKKLLSDAGYADGFEFNVIAIDTIRKNTLEYIKLDLAQLDINLTYDLVTMQEAVDQMNANEHDAILVGWAFSTDPNGVLPVLLGTGSGKTQNSSRYSNVVFDDLVSQARAETDLEQKRLIYEEVNEIVTNDSPIIVLLNPMVSSAASKSIEGIQFNSQGLINYETIYRK